MKHLSLSLMTLMLGMQLMAQNVNRISFFYGFATNDLIINQDLDGGPSFEGKGIDIFGVSYQRFLNKNLSLETGIEYSKSKIEITPNFYPGINMTPQDFTIKMFTIPIYANFTFLKYFYANAGFLIDFETNRDEYPKTEDQSGIGFGAGIGAQYTFQNFTIYLNPMIRYHAVLPLPNADEYHQQRLAETGVKFGLGYNF